MWWKWRQSCYTNEWSFLLVRNLFSSYVILESINSDIYILVGKRLKGKKIFAFLFLNRKDRMEISVFKTALVMILFLLSLKLSIKKITITWTFLYIMNCGNLHMSYQLLNQFGRHIIGNKQLFHLLLYMRFGQGNFLKFYLWE